MCIQLDLEVMCKKPRKKIRPFNFHSLWSKEVFSKKHLKKERTLMFEC
jgi:hypothetical protein